MASSYDTAIIGAGLAGLTAASTLNEHQLVVLEAAPRAGGRILTKTYGDLTYELGAIFAGPQRHDDLLADRSPLKAESSSIGIFYEERLVFAEVVAGCLNQLRLVPAEKAAVHAAPDRIRAGAESAAAKGLECRSASGRFQHRHLVEVSLYQMDQERPVYLGKTEEGNVALNGIVLQAEPENEPLKHYLMAASRDDLWEWQDGFGITLDDSAFVTEGLLAAGVPAPTLQPSTDKLVAWFFDDARGAFCTLARLPQDRDKSHNPMARGRAAYWSGPTVDATAHAVWLLHHVAPPAYATQIHRGLDYLQHTQTERGSWSGRWFPSAPWTIWFATRALALEETAFALTLQRSLAFLTQSQMIDGSWRHRIIDTSLALLTINHLAPGQHQLLHRAKQWLLHQRRSDGTWPGGEPVLYYWYELENGNRVFCHCVDRGAVATAWARLALAG